MSQNNTIGWFDITVNEMDRAVTFYEKVFNRKLEAIGDPTGETHMMGFPADMSSYGAAGALVKSNHSSPGIGGTLIYFSVEDCAIIEAKVDVAGGRLIRPKFSIGDFGWVSLCEDTEGNMFGLNSMK